MPSLPVEAVCVVGTSISSLCILVGAMYRERQVTRRAEAELAIRCAIAITNSNAAVLDGIADVRRAERSPEQSPRMIPAQSL
jgi:hypothetical protein